MSESEKGKFVAIVTRTLKEGKSYEDYRRAWFHTNGFGVPTTMYTIVNTFNPREIISIGIIEAGLEDMPDLLNIDVEDRLANPLDDVIESTIVRQFGVIVAEDDFSPAGKLSYVPAQVDGKETDFNELEDGLAMIAHMIQQASSKRDQLKLKQKPSTDKESQ